MIVCCFLPIVKHDDSYYYNFQLSKAREKFGQSFNVQITMFVKGNLLRFQGRLPGGGTPLYGLYGDVPLDRLWFLASLS